jgi:hypothetical protein
MDDQSLLSVKALINASLCAVLLALIILFTAVLPAEYGIDPTGMGQKLGLTALAASGQKNPVDCAVKSQQSKQPVAETESSKLQHLVAEHQPLDESKPIRWHDTVTIVIPPRKGLEYKFVMSKGAALDYSWQTDGESIYFDFHGEPEGASNGYFKSYLETKDKSSKGRLTAPFNGIHGWYWENATDKAISITLNSNGQYRILGVMK